MADEQPKDPGGRPTKCTPEVIEQFGEYMASGLYLEDAAGLCYITRRTAHNWLSWGEEAMDAAGGDLQAVPEQQHPYARFFHIVRAAEARAIARSLALVQRGAQDRAKPTDDKGEPLLAGDWRAAEAFLKMRKPDSWGKREQKHQHVGKDDGPMQHEFHIWTFDGDGNGDGDGDEEEEA